MRAMPREKNCSFKGCSSRFLAYKNLLQMSQVLSREFLVCAALVNLLL